MICMAVMFSGSVGKGTFDTNFILPLIERVLGVFDLKYILADKAYLSEKIVGRLWQMGMQAVIPIKKRWNGDDMKVFYEAFQHLVRWYDDRQVDFHEIYRLRPKVEAYFSLIKNMTSGYCWSRGRPRKDANGKIIPINNTLEVCTAWKNETLCKVIYVNLRLTVQYELFTEYRMNYMADTFFPALPKEDRLIA